MSVPLKGSIKLFIGPMWSGKSSSMCVEVEKHLIANYPCIIVKYADDTRYKSPDRPGLVTHAGYEHYKVPTVKTKLLADIFDELCEYDVIGFDEVQLFSDSVEVLQRLANSGKIVIAAGLDANSFGRPFGRISELIALSEEVIKLKSICMECMESASFTHRIIDGEDEIDIGGLDKYRALCRRCRWPHG